MLQFSAVIAGLFCFLFVPNALAAPKHLRGHFVGHHQMRPSEDVIGNPNAPVGGTFSTTLDAEPDSLNPLKSTDAYGAAVQSYCFDTLLQHNIQNYQYEPSLAVRWSVAPNGKYYTFWLRKDAKFTDGEPVTASDVKFSFDAFNNPKLADAVNEVYFQNIASAKVLGPYEVRFYVKRKYFLNLDTIATMDILPKSVYGNPKKNMSRQIVGSGPYKLAKFNQGQEIVLVRNNNWWGFKTPQNRGFYKFKKIIFRVITNQTAQLEALERGDLSFLGLTPEQFVKKTSGYPWGKKVFKRQVENSIPHTEGFIGLNFAYPLFKDVRVRRALSLLLNRKLMIQKFYFNKYSAATGPWYSKSPDADPRAKPFAYNPSLARKLLKEAGWADTNHDGVLDKMINGHRVDFRFSVINGGGPWAKILTFYQQELRKNGIQLIIKQVDWNSLETDINEGKFQAVAMAWGGVVYNDPKQIWASSSHVNGGSNFIGYSNPKVDRLINEAREDLNLRTREPMMHEIYSLIRNDYPYIFLWSPKYSLYAYDSKMHMLRPTYKYDIGTGTWWANEKVAP